MVTPFRKSCGLSQQSPKMCLLHDLKEKSNCLPEKSDKIEGFVKNAMLKHDEVLKKAQKGG